MDGLLVKLLEKQLYIVRGVKCDIYTEADVGKNRTEGGKN